MVDPIALFNQVRQIPGTPVYQPQPFIGPGAGNYGTQDVYIAPGSNQQWVNDVNQRANNYNTLGVSTTNQTTNNPFIPSVKEGSTKEEIAAYESQQRQGQLNDQARNEINAGYDAYQAELDQILNSSLPAQKAAQEGMVKGQYETGMADLAGQKTQGMADLATQKRKLDEQKVASLKDIATNMRNQLIAGNVYLGARGAGDSSAANMYSYALTKEGNKQRGNVMGQTQQLMADVADREFKLSNIFNTETNKLKNEMNVALNNVAQWFAEAQNQIRQQAGQLGANRGKDLAALSQQALQYAQNQILLAQQQIANKQNMLEQWAINKSNDLASLKQNLANVTQGFNPTVTQQTPVNAVAQMFTGGSTPVQKLYSQNTGNTSTDDKWWV
jgi:hypothetical protein